MTDLALLDALDLPAHHLAEDLVHRANLLVRSALYDFDQIVDDTLEGVEEFGVEGWGSHDNRDPALRLVQALVERQIQVERSWGDEHTDVDRLLAAAESLGLEQIHFFEDHGIDVRDGHLEARERIVSEHSPVYTRGYVFYTCQDLERVLNEQVLTLGFGGWGFTPIDQVLHSLLVALQDQGLAFEAGDVSRRVLVSVHWQRRGWASGELGCRH